MLTLIKLLHTLIWAIMAAATLYIVYAGMRKKFNTLLWVSIGLVTVESVVLLFNGMVCPLTNVALQYTTAQGANYDIYLPNWLAQYNKEIFGTLFIVGLLLVIGNAVQANGIWPCGHRRALNPSKPEGI